jgi:hypothetical protein
MKRQLIVWSILLLAAPALAKATFTATWKSPEAANVKLAGKKVVGLVVSEDLNLRMSSEEELARALTSKGLKGVSAFTVIPREEIHDKDRAQAWFQRIGAAAVVIMRLVDVAKETTPSVVVWSSAPYYSTLDAYYPYAWGATFNLGGGRTDITVAIETLVYDVATAKMLWAGTSESTNPKDAQALVKSIVDAAADRIKKDGLAKRP